MGKPQISRVGEFLHISNRCIHEMIAASIHLTGAPALKACGSMPPTPTRTRINIFIEEATEKYAHTSSSTRAQTRRKQHSKSLLLKLTLKLAEVLRLLNVHVAVLCRSVPLL